MHIWNPRNDHQIEKEKPSHLHLRTTAQTHPRPLAAASYSPPKTIRHQTAITLSSFFICRFCTTILVTTLTKKTLTKPRHRLLANATS